MPYWLFKTEPESYSFGDLMNEPDRSTGWDGVRNYQARNTLRDDVKPGDGVLIYHSSTSEPAIVGVAEVTRGGHPDPTAFDPKDAHFDPKSDPAAPTWYQVTIRAVAELPTPLTLAALRALPGLERLDLLRKGNRLSIQPVRAQEWALIVKSARKPTRKKG